MGRMFESGPGSQSAFTNTTMLESAANRLIDENSATCTVQRSAHRPFTYLTADFHSRKCTAADILRAVVADRPALRRADRRHRAAIRRQPAPPRAH